VFKGTCIRQLIGSLPLSHRRRTAYLSDTTVTRFKGTSTVIRYIMANNGESSMDGSNEGVHVSPEWVLSQHRQQQEINATIMQSLTAIQASLGAKTPNSSQATAAAPTAVVGEPQGTRKAKHSLSHPDKYDGKSKAAYPAFKGILRAKLRIDQAAIGSEEERVWYGFGRLSGKAADRIFPWIESTQQRGMPLFVDPFFDQLDAAFYDPQISQRALEWINNKRQESTPFRDFLQEFEQKLLEAGGWEFSDSIRKGYLKAALNLEIKTQLVAQMEPASYAEYVNLVRRTSDNLDEIKRLKGKQKGWSSTQYSHGRTRETNDQMDWEPTAHVASGKPAGWRRNDDDRPRAKWVTQDVLAERRTNGQCLRCGKKDHFIEKCSYGPARPPTTGRKGPVKKTKVATAKSKTKKAPEPTVEEVEELTTDDSETDSENE
jgi:hypothetical protein